MKKLLVVVDMQNDFVTGTLGSRDAQAILENVVEKVKKAEEEGSDIIFTQDTHGDNYMDTQEGKNLPVPHCIKGTQGWEIVPELSSYARKYPCVEKPAFGSIELAHRLAGKDYGEIQLIGLCTDICVISNAMLLKAAFPEVPVTVDAACCAGVTPESHKNALEAMKMCQISIQ